jgi:FtsP/CotA-like multicopper oxidase with cupredoxin domain
VERFVEMRRDFLRTPGLATGALLFSSKHLFPAGAGPAADYIVRIKAAPIEIAPNQILSTLTYNGQFPGPLICFQEGREVTVDIFNDTDTPEQLHWHGQIVSTTSMGLQRKARPTFLQHGRQCINFTP